MRVILAMTRTRHVLVSIIARIDTSQALRTMQTNDGKDEAQAQDQDDDRVDPQARALVSVKLEHGTGRATGTGSASRAGSGIAQRLLVVGSRATTQSSSRTTGRSGRGGTGHGRDRASGTSTRARSLGVWARLGTRGQGGGSTRRRLKLLYISIAIEK